MRPEWVALEQNIAAIPGFLRGTQPDGAIIDQFGLSVHCGGMLRLEVAVGGWNSGPGGELGTKDTCRVHVHNRRHDPDEPEPDPLIASEVAEITGLIAAAGLTVLHQWGETHGGKLASWGCTFPQIHPTLKKARQRYHDTCPKPGHSVFCGPGAGPIQQLINGEWVAPEPTAQEREKMECTWRQGFALTVPPAWVAVPWPIYATGGDDLSQSNRNLDAVLAALALLRPVVEELGIVPSTLTVGRRGRVEDGEFVDEEGLGVTLPAEAAARLAELLRTAVDLAAL